MATIRDREGKWQVQVRRAGIRPVSKTFDTHAAAKRWATKVEREMDTGEWLGGAKGGTVGDLIRQYVHEAEDGRPLRRNKLQVLRRLEARIGPTRLRDLTTEAVIAYARKRRKEGAGRATVGMDLSYLGTVLRHARALWRVQVTPVPVREAQDALTIAGEIGKSGQRDRRPTAEEIERLIGHFARRPRSGIPMGDVMRFAIASGMRLGEICRIRWDDFDEKRRLVLIRDRKDPRNKEGRNELIPLLPIAGYDPLALILSRPREGELIWPYKAESASSAWIRACSDLGIKDLHFHDLRAEFASRALEAGMSIEQVALVTGHRQWAMLKRYARLRGSDLVARFAPDSPTKRSDPPDDRTPSDPT